MVSHCIRNAAVVSALTTAFAPLLAWSQGRPEPLRALARPSNDFAPSDDTAGVVVAVPPPVAAVIDSLARAAYASECSPPPDCGTMTVEDFYGSISRITMPNDRYLYVFHEPQLFGGGDYLIVYRPAMHRATAQRFPLAGRWMDQDEMLYRPTVVFQDVAGVGSPAVGLEEVFHHGTDDTGWRYRYFSVDAADQFHPVIATESYWADSIVESTVIDSPREENAVITRRLTLLAPNRLRLDCRLERPGRASLELGYAILVRRGAGAPFVVAERHAQRPRYADMLLSMYGVASEQDLLAITEKQ